MVNWVQVDSRWHDLLKLPPARIDAALIERKTEGEETLFRFSLCNPSATAAVDAWFELLRGRQGEEILPTFWSDNGFVLLPGQRRRADGAGPQRPAPGGPAAPDDRGLERAAARVRPGRRRGGAFVGGGHRVPRRSGGRQAAGAFHCHRGWPRRNPLDDLALDRSA